MPGEEPERVLHALVERLRLELAAVEREGNRITVVGLGPTRRANQHNRTVIDVSAGVDGSIVDADVYFHPVIFIKHARQEEMMRLRFDEIFGGMKDLLERDPRPETVNGQPANAVQRPAQQEQQDEEEQEAFHIEEYLRNGQDGAVRKGKASRVTRIKDAVRRKARPLDAGAAPPKQTRESSSARVRAARGTRQRHDAEAEPAKISRIHEVKAPVVTQVPASEIQIAARIEDAAQPSKAASAQPAWEPVVPIATSRIASGIAAALSAQAPARVIPLVPAVPARVIPLVPAPQAAAAAVPVAPVAPREEAAASAALDVPSVVPARNEAEPALAVSAPAPPPPVPAPPPAAAPPPTATAEPPPALVDAPQAAAAVAAAVLPQAAMASTPHLHYVDDDRLDEDAEQPGDIRRWVLWGALAASVAATISLGVRTWTAQQPDRPVPPVRTHVEAAEDKAPTAPDAASLAAAAGDPSGLLRQWEAAMRSSDAKEQASFYAVPVERYLNRANATKEQIIADKQAEIARRREDWTVAIEQVKITRPTDTTTIARLVKHYTGHDSGSSVNERFVLSELRLRNDYGLWWITSERDLGWAGSREKLDRLATSLPSARPSDP